MNSRSGPTEIDQKFSCTLNIGFKETEQLHVDGPNRRERYRRTAFERKLTFEPQSGVGPGNFSRVQPNDRIRVTNPNGSSITDLQPLIVSLQGWNDYLPLYPSFVVQWTFRRGMHFQNAAWSIAFRGCVQGKQALDGQSFGVERCPGVISVAEIHGSTCLDEGLGHF